MGTIEHDIELLAGTIPIEEGDLIRLLSQAASELTAEAMLPVRLMDLPPRFWQDNVPSLTRRWQKPQASAS
jgi:hypothetical protein